MNPNITRSSPWGPILHFAAPPRNKRKPSEKIEAACKILIETLANSNQSIASNPLQKRKSNNQASKPAKVLNAAKARISLPMILRQFTPPNVYGVNEMGLSPMTYAIGTKQPELMWLLKAQGADIDGVDGIRWTPMTYAVAQNDQDMVNLLKTLGADINGVNGDGQTPLNCAIAANNAMMVRLLRSLGADPNKIDGNGWTPITYAIAINQYPMVGLLRELRADINKPNGDGQTPMTLAIEMGKLEAVRLLKDSGAQENIEQIERRFLAHVWGIRGFFNFSHWKSGKVYKVPYEGMFTEYTMKMLSEYARAFFNEPKYASISKGIRNQVCDAIVRGFKSPSEITAIIQRGEPVMIAAGRTDHVISMVLFKGQLAVCNRGAGRKSNAVEFYALPLERVTPQIIEKLTKEYPSTESFDQMFKSLKLTLLSGYDQKNQKTGNCAWSSPKAAFGALFHLYFGREAARILYKDFTFFTRERSLILYRKNSVLHDRDLLAAIDEKRKKKIEQAHSLFFKQ